MKGLPIGVQTFEDLITGGFLYVDKTAHVWELVRWPKGRYFLARPRRFGKSLLLTTLKAVFEGKRALFEGLAIADKPYDWAPHPVIHLDMSKAAMETPEDLKGFLRRQTDALAEQYGVELRADSYEQRFGELVQQLARTNGVVILIDEYDKPILDNLADLERAKAVREALGAFYGVIKAADEHVRFVFLTGVTKFSKVSVFSKLNNLDDLTMSSLAGDILGYTQSEIEDSFDDRMTALGETLGVEGTVLRDRIRHWYDGYRFSARDVRVYNPVSTMLLLRHGSFSNYWFETGTPRLLLDMIESSDFDIRDAEGVKLPDLAFSTYEVDQLKPEPLLFQTGYLTITDYDPDRMLYTLGYPNFEVKNSFLYYLVDRFSSVRKERAATYLERLLAALDADDLPLFFEALRAFFANIPYDIQIRSEKYYQSVFYLVFTLLGYWAEAEVRTNRGRADVVVQTDTEVYVFEFKLFDTKESALAQIKERTYFEKYLGTGKTIHLVGVELDKDDRNIGGWVEEVVGG
jgi:hypothetical protein